MNSGSKKLLGSVFFFFFFWKGRGRVVRLATFPCVQDLCCFISSFFFFYFMYWLLTSYFYWKLTYMTQRLLLRMAVLLGGFAARCLKDSYAGGRRSRRVAPVRFQEQGHDTKITSITQLEKWNKMKEIKNTGEYSSETGQTCIQPSRHQVAIFQSFQACQAAASTRYSLFYGGGIVRFLEPPIASFCRRGRSR